MLRYKKTIYIFIIMFSLFDAVKAEYKKKFFDFSIKNINEETINLSLYKNKTILVILQY